MKTSVNNLNQYIDHTLLKANATLNDIEILIEEAKKFQFKAVCLNPYWVKTAADLLKDSNILICTVIGFPLGATTLESKVFETKDALNNGADEIDMVINIGALKDKNYSYVLKEIKEVVKAADGKTVKVIIEIALLTEEEIIKASQLVVKAGANFVKTSTGFSTSGATISAVKLIKATVLDKSFIKAAGGIKNQAMMRAMIEAGADRIGTSSGVALIKDENSTDKY